MRRLYEYNLSFFQGPHVLSSRASDEDITGWGGPRVRLMLQTLYIVAFLCLLRFDEALSMTWDNVHFEHWENTFRVRLELTVRKTHQYGGIYSHYLSIYYVVINSSYQVLHRSISTQIMIVHGFVQSIYWQNGGN